jgi:hypothetical protein
MSLILWDSDNPLKVIITQAIDYNQLVLREPRSDAEKEERRNRRNKQTPSENLRDLFWETFRAHWRASPFYSWFEEFCPGYQVFKMGGTNSVSIEFADHKQAVLFKLTWG